MMKRLCAMIAALVMVLCAVSATAENADGDPVLVTVNGQEIRESDKQLQFWITYLTEQTGVESDEDMAELKQYAMKYTIQYSLLDAIMSEQGVGVTEEQMAAAEADIRASWEEAVTDIMQNEFGISADATAEDQAAGRADTIAFILSNYGYTEESFVEENLVYYRLSALTNNAVTIAASGIVVTEEDAENYYNELVQESKELIGDDAGAYEFYTNYYGYDSKYIPEGYRGISHILLPVDEELLKNWQDLQAKLEEDSEGAPAVTQDQVDAAKQAILDSVQGKVDEIKEKLAAGTSFEDLILEYGTDTGMQNEATRNSGYLVHANSIMFDSDFQNGAMALEKIGDISEPIVSQFGVHILKYLRDVPGGAAELTDEMKAEIIQDLTSEQASQTVYQWMEQAESAAEIIWTTAGEPWKIVEEAAAE